MTTSPKRLDRIDIGILSQLQQNARITNAELARAVNLSPTPCFNRVRALEKLGLFKQQVTLAEPGAARAAHQRVHSGESGKAGGRRAARFEQAIRSAPR